MPFICKCQKIYKVNDKTFKIDLYFDSYKSSMDCQRNKKCKNYIQLNQLKMIKRTKNRLKRKVASYTPTLRLIKNQRLPRTFNC